jgi:hypothetical protein
LKPAAATAVSGDGGPTEPVLVPSQQPTTSRSSEDDRYQELLKKANRGDAQAQFDLALWYFGDAGRRHSTDLSQTVYWARKAAEGGVDGAQWWLGHLYYAGIGVPKDDAMAVRWYQAAAAKSCNQTNTGAVCFVAHAQYDLGSLYITGEGVPPDLTKALFWMKQAAASLPAGKWKDQAVLLRDMLGDMLAGREVPPERLAEIQRLAREEASLNPSPH